MPRGPRQEDQSRLPYAQPFSVVMDESTDGGDKKAVRKKTGDTSFPVSAHLQETGLRGKGPRYWLADGSPAPPPPLRQSPF